MRREEVFSKLTEIFRTNFNDDSIELNDSTDSKDIDGWDSLEQIELIVAIQNEFGLKFNIEEVNSLSNVGEMVDSIVEKMGE